MGSPSRRLLPMPARSTPPPVTIEELRVACEIQRLLLPKQVPKIDGFEIDSYYNPSKALGGDYYDFIEIDPKRLGLLIADVSGKGLPAALVMVQVRGLMRAEAKNAASPREALIRVNRGLAGEIPRGMFVTIFYALLDIPRSRITICNAGHNHMLYWWESKQASVLVTTESMAVGIDKTGRLFEKAIQEKTLSFERGDRFVLYTDGVTEALNGRGEQYGFGRLLSQFKRLRRGSCGHFLSQLLADLHRFREGAAQNDDVTVIAARRLPSRGGTDDKPRLVSSGRYVTCRSCQCVTSRDRESCEVCGGAVPGPQEAARPRRDGELLCPCGARMRAGPPATGCPNCGKALCGMCRREFAAVGHLGEKCIFDLQKP